MKATWNYLKFLIQYQIFKCKINRIKRKVKFYKRLFNA